jgi:alkylation response protein AidB-like acyl-CoA dehydrogenase
MDLTFGTELEALVAATAEWCREKMPLEASRALPPTLWGELDAMGWTAMTAPGGMSLDHASEAMVFAELGRHLAPVALLSSAVAARWIGVYSKVALALVEGSAARVFDFNGAEQALGKTEAGVGFASLPSGLKGEPGLDLSVPMVRLDTVPAFAIVDDRRAELHLQLLVAAFAVGCAEAACGMAAGYAQVREQFERPIGWFQAIKHICADMAVRTAAARSQLCFAAGALDAGDREAAFHIAAARLLAGQAAIENGRANIQIHGGIGLTDEAYPHLCLKRAHLLSFIAPAEREILLGEVT